LIVKVDCTTHRAAMNALPYTNRPVAARALSPIGRGLAVLIALGMLLPARMIDARRASSVPYGCLFWIL
jgi:hypothetical protein